VAGDTCTGMGMCMDAGGMTCTCEAGVGGGARHYTCAGGAGGANGAAGAGGEACVAAGTCTGFGSTCKDTGGMTCTCMGGGGGLHYTCAAGGGAGTGG
jgi:hypothetical protein